MCWKCEIPAEMRIIIYRQAISVYVGRGRELRAARCVRCVRVGSGCVKYILVYKGQYLYSMLSYQLRDSFEALQSAAAALQKYSPWPRPEHSPGPGLGDLLLV